MRSQRDKWLTSNNIQNPAVLAVPFAGCGPSIYSALKDRLARDWGLECYPVRPPGLESRFAERRAASHSEYARGLASEIASSVRGAYVIFGHCGAVPYVIETLRMLEALHGRSRLPDRVVFSGWGPPHKGLYGALNFRNPDEIAFDQEVLKTARATGVDLIEEFKDIYAEQLEFDVRQQRSYVFDELVIEGLRLHVVGWANDEVVNPEICVDHAWSNAFPGAEISYSVITGGHFSFMDSPDELCRILTDGLFCAEEREF